MTTTLTGKNQITLPAALAQQYGLKAGTRIEWLPGAEPGEFRGRIVPEPATVAAGLRGAGRKHLRPGSHPLTRLLAERASEDSERKAAL